MDNKNAKLSPFNALANAAILYEIAQNEADAARGLCNLGYCKPWEYHEKVRLAELQKSIYEYLCDAYREACSNR